MAFEIFYSYSHKDEELRKRLDSHLALLVRNGSIRTWHDRRIEPGQEWANQIDAHIRSSQIILLLVSSDFLASDYCYELEMKTALERHSRGEAIVVPIILRPCDWSASPFAHLQAVPRDGKAVTAWPNRDQAFTEVTKAIRELASRFQEPSSPPADALAGFVDRASPKPRVLDAAMPGHIVEGRATELLMLIRLPESKGLTGVLQEDDEAEARPEDVRSKPFEVTFPLGPTGAAEPLKVTVELTSPDFKPSVQRKNIFVPVDRDSEVCPFLLTPSRTGVLTVVIELIWEDAERGFRRLRTNCVSESGLPQMPSLMNVVRLPLTARERPLALAVGAGAESSSAIGVVSAPQGAAPDASPPQTTRIMPPTSAPVASSTLPSSAPMTAPSNARSKLSGSPLVKISAMVVCIITIGTVVVLQRQGGPTAVPTSASPVNSSPASSAPVSGEAERAEAQQQKRRPDPTSRPPSDPVAPKTNNQTAAASVPQTEPKDPDRFPAAVPDNPYAATSDGTVIWESEVHGVAFVRFTINVASTGAVLSGKFPSGQPYLLQIAEDGIATVVSAPEASTNFNSFVLRVQGEGLVRLTLHWKLLSADSR